MKVVIVGQAPRSFDHPDDHEVWVINGPHVPPRWDRLFQLHGLDHLQHKHFEKKDGVRAAMLEAVAHRRLITTPSVIADPDFTKAEAYPLAEVADGHGVGNIEMPRRYLTGSFALAVALAVHEKAERIVLDGIMFGQDTLQWGASEGWAVPCLEYHLGRAEALGIDVEVPPGCGLFRASEFVYGFEGPGCV